MLEEAPLAGAWVVSPWPSTVLLGATLVLAVLARGRWPRLAAAAVLLTSFGHYAWHGPTTLAAALWLLTVGWLGVRRAQSERPLRPLFVALLLLPIFASNVLELFGLYGAGLQLGVPLHFIGTSYLALELIGHLVDGRTMAPQARAASAAPLDFFASHGLFTKALAGPICRARELAPAAPATLSGSLQLAYGAVLKLVISDNLWAAASTIDPHGGVLGAWSYGVAYVVHLYLDFAGYSHMAIGAGAMLGYQLPPNFQQPFFATSISEFWRRWHMTLSFWLRDYLFARLARRKWLEARKQALLASFGVMVVCGAWHGFAPGFLLWGALHGAAIVFERSWVARKRPEPPAPVRRLLTWGFLVLSFLAFAFPADLKLSALQAAVGLRGLGALPAGALLPVLALVAVTAADHFGAVVYTRRSYAARLTPELVAFALTLAFVLVYALGFSGAQFIYAGF